MNKKRVMIMAGGTGGHIFPGLALAAYLQQFGYDIHWLGAKGLETKLVPEHGFKLHALSMKGVRGKGILGYLKAPFMLLSAIVQARKILKQFNPQCVVGFGGFAAAPGGFAAKTLGIPIIIHEQNATAGLTNRLLGKISTCVLGGFPCNLPRCQVVGNPVRQAFFDLPKPKLRYQTRENQPLNILIIGGSQGARKLNQIIPLAIAISGKNIALNVWHQTGGKLHADAQTIWQTTGHTPFKIAPFIDEIAHAYSWADLVICRAGASTIAELAAAGVASILIPFPAAVDDHQTLNARYLSDQQAAILVAESDLTAEHLAALIQTLSRQTCLNMALKAYALSHRNAVLEIGRTVQRWDKDQ